MLETSLCQIPQQGERTLTHFWHFVLNRWREQHKVNNASDFITSLYQISDMWYAWLAFPQNEILFVVVSGEEWRWQINDWTIYTAPLLITNCGWLFEPDTWMQHALPHPNDRHSEEASKNFMDFFHGPLVIFSGGVQTDLSTVCLCVRESQLFTCMHWYMRVRMLLRATSCSMVPPKPSASPLRRSRATIMKSLSGASYWSGCDWWS